MKKTLTALLLSSFVVTSVFAMNATGTVKITDPVKLSCASTAVLKREDSVIAAQDTMSSTIKKALTERRDSLSFAWSMTDKTQRETAKKATWSKFKKDTQAAHNTMRETRKLTWKNFDTEMKACGLRDHGEKPNVVANPTYAY